MNDDTRNIQLNITGRVQGVGFRYSAVRKANEHNIKGFVKNQYDGSVLIEAEGNQTDLEHFIHWCETGPRSAYVEKVNKSAGTVRNYPNFTVRH